MQDREGGSWKTIAIKENCLDFYLQARKYDVDSNVR